MNQCERRRFLIQYLLDEDPEYSKIEIPSSQAEQQRMLRGLMNVRMPKPIGKDFLLIQDEFLSRITQDKGIVKLTDMERMREGIYLWQGDITRIAADAIVNAANSGMTGCYHPNHNCIDNCIHSYAGVQLRLNCAEIMSRQGCEEPTGQAKITTAYNLPCKYILHTVGPIIHGRLTMQDEALLASCYRSCLELAEKNELKNVAFCCISTGVFCFPNQRAAEIAVDTVMKYKEETGSEIEVIFNVFKDMDYEIYRELLQ